MFLPWPYYSARCRAAEASHAPSKSIMRHTAEGFQRMYLLNTLNLVDPESPASPATSTPPMPWQELMRPDCACGALEDRALHAARGSLRSFRLIPCRQARHHIADRGHRAIREHAVQSLVPQAGTLLAVPGFQEELSAQPTVPGCLAAQLRVGIWPPWRASARPAPCWREPPTLGGDHAGRGEARCEQRWQRAGHPTPGLGR
jgi:hypothetical protein